MILSHKKFAGKATYPYLYDAPTLVSLPSLPQWFKSFHTTLADISGLNPFIRDEDKEFKTIWARARARARARAWAGAWARGRRLIMQEVHCGNISALLLSRLKKSKGAYL